MKEENKAENTENTTISISLKNAVTSQKFALDLPSDVRMIELLPALAEKLEITNGSDFILMNATKKFHYQSHDSFISTNTKDFDYCILEYTTGPKTVQQIAKKENKKLESRQDEENSMECFNFAGMTFFVYKELNNKEKKRELDIIISQYFTLLEENDRLKKQILENNTINNDLLKTKGQLNIAQENLHKTKYELNRLRNDFDRIRMNEKISKILSISSIILIIVGIVMVIPRYTETRGTIALAFGLAISLLSILFQKIQNLYVSNHNEQYYKFCKRGNK